MVLFRPLYQFPRWMQRLYRHVIWRGDVASPSSGRPAVYLTFDDGPIPEMTPKILSVLREKHVHATFFVVGDNVRKYPDLLEDILREGHRVGNHTFHHLPGLQYPTWDYLNDVAECNSMIAHAIGEKKLLRPPYGRMKTSQKRALTEQYQIVLWDVLTHDYNKNYSPEKMLAIVTKYTRPGSIVVFHDSQKSGERMLQVLPQVIDWWHEHGYELCLL